MPEEVDFAERYFFEQLQMLLSRKKSTLPKTLHRICGVDASYRGDDVKAVASVLNVKGEILEQVTYEGHVTYPYASGLFFLREGPFVVQAVKKLGKKPDLVCFDAHGLAHPRRKGLATICGMVNDIPSIGISKSKLVGEIRSYKGQLEKLVYQHETVGFVTHNPRRFWSPGFSVSLAELESIILEHGSICIGSISKSHESAMSMDF